MKSKRLLILGNMSRPGIVEQIRVLRSWFAARLKVVAVKDASRKIDVRKIRADLCIVFGGDGTLLAASRALAGTKIPMLGVNMGKLGFLAEFNVEHMQKHLEEIITGQITPTARMMLQMRIIRQSGARKTRAKIVFESVVANDVAISAGAPFRMIDLHVTRGDAQVSQYFGDGLVVATPTGSTGYNLSAGGPLIEPALNLMTITPIAPHTLALRPLVVGADEPIAIKAARVNRGTAVIVDGQISQPLLVGDIVEIEKFPHANLIFPHPGWSFFTTLARKLQWGKSPHHPV